LQFESLRAHFSPSVCTSAFVLNFPARSDKELVPIAGKIHVPTAANPAPSMITSTGKMLKNHPSQCTLIDSRNPAIKRLSSTFF
jgi:hypothetical protein